MAGQEWGCCHCTIGSRGLAMSSSYCGWRGKRQMVGDAEDRGGGEDRWFYRKEDSIGKVK